MPLLAIAGSNTEGRVSQERDRRQCESGLVSGREGGRRRINAHSCGFRGLGLRLRLSFVTSNCSGLVGIRSGARVGFWFEDYRAVLGFIGFGGGWGNRALAEQVRVWPLHI